MWRPFIFDLWDTRLPRGSLTNSAFVAAGGGALGRHGK